MSENEFSSMWKDGKPVPLTDEQKKWLEDQYALAKGFDTAKFTKLWNTEMKKFLADVKPPVTFKFQIGGL